MQSNTIIDTRRFASTDKQEWLRNIERIYLDYNRQLSPRQVVLSLDCSIKRNLIEPLHLVTFACLIHFLDVQGHRVSMETANYDLHEYIFKDLDFAAYWSGGKNHVDANKSSNIFNLWRIVESEKDIYAKNVEEYFKRNYFNEKDLSAISVSLVEAFYNVFDHADANGNAFSIIFYDKDSEKLSYAVADFGIGIPTSVRRFNPSVGSDTDAILWALTDNYTVQSTPRNKGFGMSNILSAASQARIFSNHGLVVKIGDKTKAIPIDNFSFPGTLIYLTIDMASFDDEEVLSSFTL